MGKEAKIGLAVVGILLVVFGTLLFRRLSASDTTNDPNVEAQASRSTELTPPVSQKPTVVFAQRDSLDSARSGSGDDRYGSPSRVDLNAESGGYAPRPSFMPADSQPAEQDSLPDEPAEAIDAADDSPPIRSNPFQSRAPQRVSDEPVTEPTDDIPDNSPRQLEAVPADAAALESVPRRPAARRANPVRRLSAEIREGEPSGVELAVPVEGTQLPDNSADSLNEPIGQQPPIDAREADFDRSGSFARETAAALEEPASEPLAQPAYRASSYEPQPLEPASDGSPPPDGKYMVQPNDSLYLISEKVYGTSGYFKALAEHNRARLPQIHRLTVGTVIFTPPASELQQKYPALCPKPRKSALVRPQTMQASTRGRTLGGNTYVVEEGDTLFDIARYELGKASRWGEIYNLNRELLGEDFDYLKPGIELVMPPKDSGRDNVTRGRDPGFQR